MKYLFAALLLSITSVYAQTYSEAKTGIARGDDILMYDTLKKHPLYPYLAYDFYRNNLFRDAEITTLFKQHYDAPPIKTLQNQWIEQQYQLGNYKNVVNHYFHTGSIANNCRYRHAQLLLGNRKIAFDKIQFLWLSPNNITDKCSPLFDSWSGKNDPKRILRRARLAYDAGNTAFAEQMAGKLNNTQAMTIVQFSQFARSPTALVDYSVSDLTRTPLHKSLLPRALSQLIRKDSSRYAAFAMQFAPKMRGNKDYQTMLSKLTGYLVNRQDPQARQSYALLSNPDSSATENVVRHLAATQDWAGIRKLISLKNNNSMALYWLGRALEASGKNAKAVYAKAAKTRSYYGFLSADKLGLPYQFTPKDIQPNVKIQANLSKNKSLIRAKLLYQYGEPVKARKEILPLAKRMDKNTQRQLAYWLNRQRFHHDAIYILGQLRDWDDIRIRFPLPYNRQVQAAHRLTGTDLTWIYAIIRQESSMNPRAVSRANARGLMQLIPGTARRMAKELGLSLAGSAIFNPDTNTKLGAAYLSKMHNRFGNIALASAGYNAGPGRVDQWFDNGVNDMPLWVEKIPFDETRKYVKRIAEYQQVYAKHLKKKIPTVTEIIRYKTKPTLSTYEQSTNQIDE